MIYRSKAPLRIGLAGGGTDVSPYCERYGGAVLNATVNLYARASLRKTKKGVVSFFSADKQIHRTYPAGTFVPAEPGTELHAGVYNYILRNHPSVPLSVELTTFVDVPAGSGLGTSSALVVAILGAFAEMHDLPMGEYDLARCAFEIERMDLNLAGGRQDQYAATFGGFNFMEFQTNGNVIVNPLRVKERYLDELAHNLLLYYTSTSRDSATIIRQQSMGIEMNHPEQIEATHRLKEQAFGMKEALLKGNLDRIGELLDFGWSNKKRIAEGITTPAIDQIYANAIANGATGGKISGAGGGGFMTFFCPGNTRYAVATALKPLGGKVIDYEFTNRGLSSWSY